MLWTRAGTTLLLAFLMWRGANSLVVCVTDSSLTAHWHAGLTDDLEGRTRRAFDFRPGGDTALDYGRLELLREHVPEDALVYVLHEFQGFQAVFEYQGYQRIAWLVYPRFLQMLNGMPLPESRTRPPLVDKRTFVLDVRRTRTTLPPELVPVATTPSATLYRLAG
ncbi:MAG: hypothetical protein KDC87_07265 [Planctomycetes bacterium]|nr:hypothetical protein [Planctomycetota bacterium]